MEQRIAEEGTENVMAVVAGDLGPSGYKERTSYLPLITPRRTVTILHSGSRLRITCRLGPAAEQVPVMPVGPRVGTADVAAVRP